MPLHDPEGPVLPHLARILPDLSGIFGKIFLGMTPPTREIAERRFPGLMEESSVRFYPLEEVKPAGDHFLALYSFAAAACPDEQVLHLCFPDRVAFALQDEFRDAFMKDMEETRTLTVPLIFHRSPRSWETHPRNYAEIEGFVTRLGELLFGRTLDFAWCHLALPAGRLREVLPGLHSHEISLVAELVLQIRDAAITKDVDWLAWEDPFILSADPVALKAQREGSMEENRKRLSYVIPMLDMLYRSVNHAT